MSTAYQANSTDITTYWLCLVASTGLPDSTGIAYNATGLTVQYNRIRAAAVSAVTGGGTAPVTLAAANTAHTDWGFLHIGGGVHRVDYPDAAFASGVVGVILAVFGVTDRTFVLLPMIDLVGSDPRVAAVTDVSIANAVVEAEIDALETYSRTTNTAATITGPTSGSNALTITTDAAYLPIKSIT